jgi:mannitol-1-/sugar-/sorbitol-6-/2-deoxyglucose-6-phosphatase
MFSRQFKAAVFDMDGLLLDSEPYWKRAEQEVFGAVGIHITEEMSRLTAAMTTAEVAAHWFRLQPWEQRSLRDMERAVVDRVAELVASEGALLPGVLETLEAYRALGCKVALASNSPLALCELTVRKLGIAAAFDALFSAEQVARGKPAPDIYLHAATCLAAPAGECIAFEDSVTGARAARAAGMTVVAVPSAGQSVVVADDLAHLVAPSLSWFHARYLRKA